MSTSDLRAVIGDGTVHFMGIGGAGMCALAELLHRSGHRVTGCDLTTGPSSRALEAQGVPLSAGHDPDHLEGVTLLVVSAAIPRDHLEIAAARERGIPVIKRAEALGRWVNGGTVLGIAGTHGKTTTTALATEILVAAGLDPTGVVGGHVTGWGGNLRFGRGEIFVVEGRRVRSLLPRAQPRCGGGDEIWRQTTSTSTETWTASATRFARSSIQYLPRGGCAPVRTIRGRRGCSRVSVPEGTPTASARERSSGASMSARTGPVPGCASSNPARTWVS